MSEIVSNAQGNGAVQPKMNIDQLIKGLEKEHRLFKLQTEMAEFRVRSFEANLTYAELVEEYNQLQAERANKESSKMKVVRDGTPVELFPERNEPEDTDIQGIKYQEDANVES